MKKIIKALATLGLISITGLSMASCTKSTNKVVIYIVAEEERLSFFRDEISKKFPDYDVVFQSIGTGALVSKLQAEGENTECDMFYDLEACNVELLLEKHPDMLYDLSDYDFSIYDSSVTEYTSRHHKYAINGKTCGTIIVNKKVLSEKGIEVPKTYDDLLDPKYKGLISMPNPKSSGTGYSFYNGLVSSIGESEALTYFDKLNSNIKEYTTSGSAPTKAVVRGEVAIGVGLLWQEVNSVNSSSDLDVVFLNNEASYNLYAMGLINGHEKNEAAKNVFDYFYTTLNEQQACKFNPDKVFKNQGESLISNYPTNFNEIKMNGIFDFQYKQNLLDKWKY